MTVSAEAFRAHRPTLPMPAGLIWLAVLAISLAFLVLPDAVPRWAADVPRAWRIPVQDWISAAMNWLVNDAGFGLFTFR